MEGHVDKDLGAEAAALEGRYVLELVGLGEGVEHSFVAWGARPEEAKEEVFTTLEVVAEFIDS